MIMSIIAIVTFGCSVILFAKEARTIWPGVLGTFGICVGLAAVVRRSSIVSVGAQWPAWSHSTLETTMILAGVLPVFFALFLAAHVGVAIYRGDRALFAWASGVGAVACAAYVVLLWSHVRQLWTMEDNLLARVLVASAPGMAFVGFAFLAHVLYSHFYAWFFSRKQTSADVVIVLGAQIKDVSRLTPLLKARVDAGLSVARRSDPPALLILSGGKGDDEPISEAAAMGRYARSVGFPEGYIREEDQSRTTRENLAFSKTIAMQWTATHEDGAKCTATPTYVVATSNFHCLRGAILLREYGLPGYGVGARVHSPFWITATIREFFATARDNLLPVIMATVTTIAFFGYALIS